MYEQSKINLAFNEYCRTEDPDDFAELLKTLEPMIRSLTRKWFTLDIHHADIVQEVFLVMWKKQSSINKLKLMRLKANSNNGGGFKISTYFYFVIRGYLGKIAPRINKIYNNDFDFTSWWYCETWMGNLELDEGTVNFERGAD